MRLLCIRILRIANRAVNLYELLGGRGGGMILGGVSEVVFEISNEYGNDAKF